MIRFQCTQCGKALAVADELAGKTGKCPGCQNRFVIPAPNTAVQSQVAPPALPPAHAPMRPPGGPPALPRGSTAVEAGAPRRRRPPPPEEDFEDEDDYEERPRPKKKKKKKKRRKKGAGLSGYAIFIIALCGVSLLLSGLSLVIKPLWVVPMGIGAIASVVGGLWFLIVAFQDDTLQGFLCWFVPLYSLYYLITHFEEEKRPFFLNLVGGLILLAGVCAGAVANAGKM